MKSSLASGALLISWFSAAFAHAGSLSINPSRTVRNLHYMTRDVAPVNDGGSVTVPGPQYTIYGQFESNPMSGTVVMPRQTLRSRAGAE